MINLENPATLHVCQLLHRIQSLYIKQNIPYLNVLQYFLSEPVEEYSKSFDKDVITSLDEAKYRVNSELKYLNEKLDQCKDNFRGVSLLKNKSRKRSRKQTKREQRK